MPIFNRNDSRVNGITVVADESYSYADMGHIMLENAQNDMILFNAIMRRDFQEQAAIQEGTMVASELQSFREFSAREAWDGLKAKLKKLWEKIKGVFRVVWAKLNVWFNRNGKTFALAARKALASKTGLGECEIPVYKKRKESFKPDDLFQKFVDHSKDLISRFGVDSDKLEIAGRGDDPRKKVANQWLAQVTGISDITIDNVAGSIYDNAFEEMENTTYAKLNVKWEELLNVITGKGKAIKDLKSAEKKVNKALATAIKNLDNEAKKYEKSDDQGEKNKKTNYEANSKFLSIFETVNTAASKACIRIVKTEVAQSRQVVGKLMAYSPNKESAVLQTVAWMEGADDAESMEDISPDEVNDSDIVQINVDTGDETDD